MGRQSIRQQAESNVHRRSATLPRSQTGLGRTPSSHTRPPSKYQQSAQKPAQKFPKNRSSRPWLLLVFLLWGISLAMALMATRSLLDPTVVSSTSGIPSEVNPASESASPPIAAEEDPLPEANLNESYFYQPAESNHLPIMALGSTAISCAMSCILVARALQPRRSPPQLKGRSKKRTALKSTSVQPSQSSDAKAAAPQSVPAKPPLALPAAIDRTTPGKSETAHSAIVSVMPTGQSIPLDWEEPSLADSLDLRQHRVLPF